MPVWCYRSAVAKLQRHANVTAFKRISATRCNRRFLPERTRKQHKRFARVRNFRKKQQNARKTHRESSGRRCFMTDSNTVGSVRLKDQKRRRDEWTLDF